MTFVCKISPCINDKEYSNTGMCFFHYMHGGGKAESDEKKAAAKRTMIKKESDKRAEQNKVDQKQNKELRKIVGKCQLQLTGCTGKAECVHHPEGRIGKRLTDVKQKLVSCKSCNLRAETHPQEARDKGVLKYKHRSN